MDTTTADMIQPLIPTLDRISLENCEFLTRKDSVFSRKVVRLANSNVVAKIGPDIDMTEAESMKFVRERTSIPVPKVLQANEQEGLGYIIMEFVEGEMLRKAWPKLAQKDRNTIVSELSDYMSQLRGIKPPIEEEETEGEERTKDGEKRIRSGVKIQSVGGRPVVDRRVMGAVKGGPFISEADFNTWQLQQLHPDIDPINRDIYTAMHRTDHKIFFSHGDFGFHNILVHDGHVTAVVDWESSGWFPEHWDYCKAAGFFTDNADLYDALKRIFEKQYFAEFLMDMWFTKEVKHGGF